MTPTRVMLCGLAAAMLALFANGSADAEQLQGPKQTSKARELMKNLTFGHPNPPGQPAKGLRAKKK